jgi:hypothetical protein
VAGNTHMPTRGSAFSCQADRNYIDPGRG